MARRSPFAKDMLLCLMSATILLSSAGWQAGGASRVTLSNARFQGLTRIVVNTDHPLKDITAEDIVVTRPDGLVVPASRITGVVPSADALSVAIDVESFARVTSEGTTIGTKAFRSFRASRAVPVKRPGEPAENAHILGVSQWTDEGWNSSKTDPAFVDPVTGQRGLYRFTDLTPDRDD